MRAPWARIVGTPGALPRLVTIFEQGRVATWVWPAPRTVMSLPNTKVDSVWRALTSRMVMPPRMPIVLDGVVMPLGPGPRAVLAALVAAGVRVRGIAVERETLEERFVALTGEGFDVAL